MKFAFIAKHRGIWPVSWICEALGVSRSGFHAWLVRAPSARSRSDEEFGTRVRASFISSYRTYGARRVWHDLLRDRLRNGEPALRQYYVRSIVTKVEVGDSEIRISGHTKALERAVGRTDSDPRGQVPNIERE